jgi:hypothetical protein
VQFLLLVKFEVGKIVESKVDHRRELGSKLLVGHLLSLGLGV